MQFYSPFLVSNQMETESSPMKLRRYDLSMSKRTRKAHIAMVIAQVNAEEVKGLELAPITFQDNKEGKAMGLEFAPITFQDNKEGKARGLEFAPITSEENKEGEKVINCTTDKAETVLTPPTPRPSLKELIQVTNKEERDAKEASEQDLVRDKVPEREKGENLSPGVISQSQIVSAVKQPGMVRRCAKALNHIIKVTYAPKQKNVAPLIAI